MRGISIRGAGRRRLWCGGLGLLAAAWLLLCPARARAQVNDVPDYAPASPQIPWPLGSTRPEDGGPFVYAQYTMYQWTNPLRSQPIAQRGFFASDTSLGVPIGTRFGSGAPALNVNNVNGQGSFEPGFEIGFGWKLEDGSAITFDFLYFAGTQYTNGATLFTQHGREGQDFADTFITAPVYNFPPEFAGPLNKLGSFTNGAGAPLPGAAVGIWNAASLMTIKFEQRFQQYEATYRYKLIDDEDYRVQALVGPRFTWIWERFKWRTTSYGLDLANNTVTAGPQDVGVYSNIVSNRMYGVHAGCQTECYLGHGFAVMLEGQGALFVDGVKERAKYETEAKFMGLPESKKAKKDFSLVPELSTMLTLQWYPTEFVQIQIGYELMAFFNTFASTRPIDFNYLNLSPTYDHVARQYNGFRAGIAFWF
jgi:hypothetical protein